MLDRPRRSRLFGVYNRRSIATDRAVRSVVEALESRRLLAGDGLVGTYFNGVNFDTQVTSRIDPTVNFLWGSGSPATGVNVDKFSARWTGQVQPATSETYTFYTTTDDGA